MTKDYSKGKIYSIRSRSRPDLVYVGSTIQPLSKRFVEHKCHKRYSSRDIIALGDAYIELIENYPCENVEELRKREGQLQRSMECVNNNIAGRTREEWQEENSDRWEASKKNWRDANPDKVKEIQKRCHEKHREKHLQIHKEYHQRHKEEISLRKKAYREAKRDIQTCICGSSYNYGIISRRARHYITTKHQDHVQLVYERIRALQSSSD